MLFSWTVRQNYLLPPSVDDWLLANRLARFVVEAIDQLSLAKRASHYAGRVLAALGGALTVGPASLVGVWLRDGSVLQPPDRVGDLRFGSVLVPCRPNLSTP